MDKKSMTMNLTAYLDSSKSESKRPRDWPQMAHTWWQHKDLSYDSKMFISDHKKP